MGADLTTFLSEGKKGCYYGEGNDANVFRLKQMQ